MNSTNKKAVPPVGNDTADGQQSCTTDEHTTAKAKPASGRDTKSIPPIVTLRDFLAEPIPEPPQVLHGVLRAGQVAMLAASSKVGKSWWLQTACISVADGRAWLGMKTTPGDTLYINGELEEYDLQVRPQKLIDALGLGEAPEGMDIWHLRGEHMTIRDLVPEILRRQEERGKPYALIVPDPLYYFNGGRDENDNSAQAQTMGELAELAERTGAAVLVAHHFSKGNKSQTDHLDRASGAGMFARAVDVFITMTRHTEEDCYSVETTCRSFARPEPFVVRWEYPLWRVDDSLDPYDLKPHANGKRPPRYTVEHILPHLSYSGMTYSQWRDAAMKSLGVKETTFANLLKKARDSGKVEKDVFGKYNRTEAPK